MSPYKKILYFFCTNCQPNRSSTIKYAFPLIFAVAALLGTAAVVSNSKSFIHLESSSSSVRSGQTFQIDVYVTAHVPINAVDINLTFPKEQISIVGIDIGESVITLWTEEPYIKNNSVILQGGTFRKGFLGDHKIATINARAIQTGLAQFTAEDVVLLAGDGSGTAVKVSETGKESTSLYIAHEDGTFTPVKEGVGLQGTASVVLITDIDGDGKVTLGDISRFMAAWSSRAVIYDFNGDGAMSFRDFGIILADSFLQ